MSGPEESARAPRRWLPIIARLALSVGLIVILVSQVGSKALLAQLLSIEPLFFLLACSLFLFGQILNAVRWRWLLAASVPDPPSMPHLMVLVMVGMFFNFFLPSTVGGDVARAEFVQTRVGGRTHAYLSILVGRVLAFGAVLLIGVVAMLAAFTAYGWGDLQVFAAALLFLLPIGALWWAYRSATLRRLILRMAPQRLSSISSRLMKAIDVYGAHWAVLIRVFAVAIVANMVGNNGAVLALAIGLGLDIPFYYHLIAVPLILLITLIPISFNGIGLREGAFVYFYGKAAVTATAAISLSLSFTAMLVVLSLLGGLCLLMLRRIWPCLPNVSSERGA